MKDFATARLAREMADSSYATPQIDQHACQQKTARGLFATNRNTDFAIQEKLDGKAVDWMEQVTDEQYTG